MFVIDATSTTVTCKCHINVPVTLSPKHSCVLNTVQKLVCAMLKCCAVSKLVQSMYTLS